MNIEELGNLIPDDKFVTVSFIGRTDGKVHVVTGRYGVRRYLKGGELKFNPFEKGLMPIFSYKRDSRGRFLPPNGDRKGTGYRFIPAENIISIKADGVTYNGRGERI